MRGHLAYLDVVPDGPAARGPGWLPLDAPLHDPDLTRRWVERYAEITRAQSGVAPPGMPSAFVLQHHLDPLAQVVATAAVRGTWVLDADPARWAVRLEPTFGYPVAVRVAKGESAEVADLGERVRRAQAGYLAAAAEIATAFPAAHRMSSRQRLGMGRDMWRGALHRLLGGPLPRRESCCLLYALPAMHPCGGCPRV